MLKLFDKDYLKTTAETRENANDYRATSSSRYVVSVYVEVALSFATKGSEQQHQQSSVYFAANQIAKASLHNGSSECTKTSEQGCAEIWDTEWFNIISIGGVSLI